MRKPVRFVFHTSSMTRREILARSLVALSATCVFYSFARFGPSAFSTLHDDMERLEEIVRRSNLNCTIVRSAGLFDAGDYEVVTQLTSILSA